MCAYTQAQLEQVDQLLSSMDSCAEGVLPLRVLATLLRADLCYSTRQVGLWSLESV